VLFPSTSSPFSVRSGAWNTVFLNRAPLCSASRSAPEKQADPRRSSLILSSRHTCKVMISSAARSAMSNSNCPSTFFVLKKNDLCQQLMQPRHQIYTYTNARTHTHTHTHTHTLNADTPHTCPAPPFFRIYAHAHAHSHTHTQTQTHLAPLTIQRSTTTSFGHRIESLHA